MKRLRTLLPVLAIIGPAGVVSRVMAAPSPEFGAPGGVGEDDAGPLDDATPVDPVVLEPLRPLFSDTSPATFGRENWCGTGALVTMLTVMLLLGALRLAPLRPRR